MIKLFTPYQISKMSDAAINRAYSNLRSIANKRLGRMHAKGLGMRAREGFRFPTIRSIEESSKWNVSSALADVSKWLSQPQSTMRGERQKLAEFRESMAEMGYSDLTTTLDDTYNLMQYLDDLKEQYSNDLYDSGDALDVYQHAQDLGVPEDVFRKNMNLFYENQREFLAVPVNKNGRAIGSRRLQGYINKWQTR